MQVPDPHNNENTYPVCMLILSLKALENPVIHVMIAMATDVQGHKKTSQKPKMRVSVLNQMIHMIWIRVS